MFGAKEHGGESPAAARFHYSVWANSLSKIVLGGDHWSSLGHPAPIPMGRCLDVLVMILEVVAVFRTIY